MDDIIIAHIISDGERITALQQGKKPTLHVGGITFLEMTSLETLNDIYQKVDSELYADTGKEITTSYKGYDVIIEDFTCGYYWR